MKGTPTWVTLLCTATLLTVILTQPGCQRRAAERARVEAEWDSLMSVVCNASRWETHWADSVLQADSTSKAFRVTYSTSKAFRVPQVTQH